MLFVFGLWSEFGVSGVGEALDLELVFFRKDKGPMNGNDEGPCMSLTRYRAAASNL